MEETCIRRADCKFDCGEGPCPDNPLPTVVQGSAVLNKVPVRGRALAWACWVFSLLSGWRSLCALVVQRVKNLPAIWETWVQSLSQEYPLEKEMATQPSILAWKTMDSCHGQRSLSGFSLWACKKQNTTEWLSTQARPTSGEHCHCRPGTSSLQKAGRRQRLQPHPVPGTVGSAWR